MATITGGDATDWSRVGSGEAMTSLALVPGNVVANRYEIIRLLGEGGMGAVYKARDRELDRLIALKVIRPELAGHPRVLQRFKQELLLARQVTHKNVIRIYDLGVFENLKFITMEYVEGRDLSSVLEERKCSVPEALDIIRQTCRALEAAHGENVIHRDLKPQNIMVSEGGKVSVMDFGLARSLESTGLTQAGALIGTPAYMSPEQALGNPVDARSDLFSLGIIFYEMLTGIIPFKADTMLASMLKRTQSAPPAPFEVDPTIPKDVSDVVLKCLATDAAKRYQNAGELLSDLDILARQYGVGASSISLSAVPYSGSSGSAVLSTALSTFQLPQPELPPPPPPRRFQMLSWKMIAAVVAGLAIAIAGTTAWFKLSEKPKIPPKMVTVLVADFNNATSDPVFNGTLEPALMVALEGATFITAYDREAAHRTALQLQPGAARMDEKLSQLVAQRQGVGVVVGGSIYSEAGNYRLSARAIDPFTGKVITVQELTGINKAGVLLGVAKLAARVRVALRDDTPESLQLAAAETFTAASVEAAHAYGVAKQFEGMGKNDEAIQNYLKSVELDPNLGRAYANLAAIYGNLNQPDLAEKYEQLAVARIDRMSDREKYKTRGIYYLNTRTHIEKAVEELSALVKQYPADNGGLKNLALAYAYQRDFTHALEVGRHALELYPKNVSGRSNVALYAMYAGDFDTALREARATLDLNANYERAHVAVALSELAQGHVPQAVAAYGSLEKISPLGASFAVSGLADLALYQGRMEDAAAILEKGIAKDLEAKNELPAAVQSAVLASIHLSRGRRAPMMKAAEQAIALSKDDNVRVTVARVYVEAGLDSKAQALASQLEASTSADSQAYGKIIEGEIQLRKANGHEALKRFEEARKLADTWLGRFDLGRANLAIGDFTPADSELEQCLKRRGEATALFLDEFASYQYLPPVYYYLGRAQEGMKSGAAADSYRTFLAMREKGDDPLAIDARKRLGNR